jgi:glycosyltransferase involved in cell wall biosynthesis
MSAECDFSIIIPAFNEEALLPTTLDSVRHAMAELPWRGQVIVVDNNSADRTGEVARASGAEVVFEPHNQISRARNAGARQARGRWLVFLDADTCLSPALLRQALSRLASDRVVGGGSTIAMDRQRAGGMHRFLQLWNSLSRHFGLAAGCFIFCRAEAFRAIGGFPEEVYAGEEIKLTIRLKIWGRTRGRRRFEILGDHPILTSARKAETPLSTLAGFLLVTLCPLALRFRALTWVWYRGRGPTKDQPR